MEQLNQAHFATGGFPSNGSIWKPEYNEFHWCPPTSLEPLSDEQLKQIGKALQKFLELKGGEGAENTGQP